MPKIAIIGAGSVVFTRNLLGDILGFPELADSHIALMDIDPARLHTAGRVAQKVGVAVNARPIISEHTDRRAALDGADYVINTIQVGGYKPSTVVDFEVPKRYGLRQTIADTLGIGGIMRALRTIPVMLDMAHDMEELCPGALLLNYTNPMAMLTWAVLRGSRIRAVGLCHSVQGTAHYLAHLLGIPGNEVNYVCSGINHMAFFLRLEHNGVSLYPGLRQLYLDGRVPDYDRVRFEMMMRLGYFVTESSEHFSEYVPWFIKRTHPDLIERFNIPLDEYIRRCESQNADWERMRLEFEGDEPIEVHRSAEYGSLIIHSEVTNTPRTVNASVLNHSLIDNLLPSCAVEVPCLVDRNGVQPIPTGPLPVQLAALISSNVAVQSLVVEAALTGKKDYIYQAAMMDPHTASELSLDEITALVDDLIREHGDYLPEYH